MRRPSFVLAILVSVASVAGATSCGGSQENAASGSDKRKISTMEDQLEDARADLAKEKAARTAAEQQLATEKAQCVAQVAAAKAAAPPPAFPPPPGAPGAPGVPGVPGAPDVGAPGMPPPPAPPKPVQARITEKNVAGGGGVRLILSAGRKRGVAANWTGQVFQGKSSKVIGTFKITVVREDESEGVTKDANLSTLGTSDRVELTAPPAP
jgi:hypothetical protein